MPVERITLAYVSRAASDVTSAVLENIVTTAAHANVEASITGILLFNGRHFLQILQGEKGEVEALFARIERDDRHREVTRIPADRFSHFGFPAWGMVVCGDTDASEIAEYRLSATLGRALLELTDRATKAVLSGFLRGATLAPGAA